jgi:hypothetical protein
MGLTGAKDEFLLAATVQNLKKLVRLCAHGTHTQLSFSETSIPA